MAEIDCVVCGNSCDDDTIDYCPDCINFICADCSSSYEGYCDSCYDEISRFDD